jgi:hypothetical protein
MKESCSKILWNEKIRRCEEVDIAEKEKEARQRRYYRHVIGRDEGKAVKDIMN